MLCREYRTRCALFLTMSLAQPCITHGQEKLDYSKQLRDSVARLRTSKSKTEGDRQITDRVRETTWRLMAGELAAIKSNGLHSGSYDALNAGLDELDQILKDLENSPDAERQLTQNIQLTMRLDAMNARRAEIEAAKNISRKEELERLSQIRAINRSYRDLLQQLLSSQTQLIAGQIDEGVKSGNDASQNLTKIEEIASKRRDFYLFEDEPLIEGENKDLQLVQSTSAPYSNQVLSHHHALLSLATFRSAMRENPPRREALEIALGQADAALSDPAQPNLLALYARGLINLELGKLLKRNAIFSMESENAAKPFFEQSDQSLKQAKTIIPMNVKLDALAKEIDTLLEEASGPIAFINRSIAMEEQGNSTEAIRVLHQGLMRHRDKQLALQWIDLNWRYGRMKYEEIEKELSSIEESKLISSTDSDLLNLEARIKVLYAWNLISAFPDAGGVDAKRTELVKLLGDARKKQSDIRDRDENTNSDVLKWHNEALVVLADASLMLLEPDKNVDAAKSSLARIPVIVTELESLLKNATTVNRMRLNESIYYARMAEGYLAARLLPEYQDRSRTAFAAATDAAARIPGGSSGLQLNGGALLRALLSRSDSNGERLAQEERQLRGSLQQMMPALISVQMAEPQLVAASLTKSFGYVRLNEPAWDPRKQLDPADVIGARNSVISDARAVTVLSLLSAKQPKLALKQFLVEWQPGVDAEDPEKINWTSVKQKATLVSDPLTMLALGKTVEEYAVVEIKNNNPAKQDLLSFSLNCFERADKMFKETTIWKERWPYLEGLITEARKRLVNEDFFIQRANELRKHLHITEARKVLEEAQGRHYKSVPIQEMLVVTLLDESQLNPVNAGETRSEALKQLVEARQKGLELSISTLLRMAELHEQAGDAPEAIKLYRQIIQKTNAGSEDQIRARSRMVVLIARSKD